MFLGSGRGHRWWRECCVSTLRCGGVAGRPSSSPGDSELNDRLVRRHASIDGANGYDITATYGGMSVSSRAPAEKVDVPRHPCAWGRPPENRKIELAKFSIPSVFVQVPPKIPHRLAGGTRTPPLIRGLGALPTYKQEKVYIRVPVPSASNNSQATTRHP